MMGGFDSYAVGGHVQVHGGRGSKLVLNSVDSILEEVNEFIAFFHW